MILMTSRNALLMPVAAAAPLLWILRESRTASAAHREQEARKLAPGDFLFLYTTRGCFGNPSRDRGRIIAKTVVLAPAASVDPPVRFADREYPLVVRLEILTLAPFRTGLELSPLVPRLPVTFPRAHGWAVRLRRALVPVDSAEADMLDQLLAPLTEPYPLALTSYEEVLAGKAQARFR